MDWSRSGNTTVCSHPVELDTLSETRPNQSGSRRSVSIDASSAYRVENSRPRGSRSTSSTALTANLDGHALSCKVKVLNIPARRSCGQSLGWRSGLRIAASTTLSICVINICVIIWLTTKARTANGATAGMVTAYEGPCASIDSLTSITHLVINIFGTLLLAASNYCMQCLSAPTRAECDRAHARKDWLDIGLHSPRNLLKIHSGRTILWVLLAISSLPIHLIYNSAAFKVLTSNAYEVFAVNDAFFNGSTLSTPRSGGMDFASPRSDCIITNTAPGWQPHGYDTRWGTPCFSDCTLETTFNENGYNITDNLSYLSLPDLDNSFYGRNQTYILKYANNTVTPLNFSNPSPQAWQPFEACNFSNCTMTVGNLTKSGFTILDAIEECYDHDPRDVDWRPHAIEAQRTSMLGYGTYDIEQCISMYSQDFVSDYNNVFFVAIDTWNESLPSVYFYSGYNHDAISNPDAHSSPYDWLCTDLHKISKDMPCTSETLQRYTSNFTLGGVPISSCRAQKATDAFCKLQFSIVLLAVVIACNTVKAVLMLFTICWLRQSTLMVTGDAIASYLNQPDLHSIGQCCVDLKKIQLRNQGFSQILHRHHAITMKRYYKYNQLEVQANSQDSFHTQPTQWTKQTNRRRLMINVVSIPYLLMTVTLALACITVAAILLKGAEKVIADWIQLSPWAMGFGRASSRLVLTLDPEAGSALPFTNAMLISNVPQLLVSFVYILYNGLLSSMLQAREWSEYAVQKKALRVTNPLGTQRSTYFLSLPYKFAIPLMVASALLHWLISSSLFLVRVDGVADGQQIRGWNYSFIGYSPLPLLLALILGGCMLVGGAALGCWRLPSSMPLISSNSFGISAACHAPAEDVDAALLPVQWGETKESSREPVGHCSFTSQEVVQPQVGRIYA